MLTGFGPFPGIDSNATSELIPELIEAARARFPEHDVVGEFCRPNGSPRRRSSETSARPGHVLALHFGVSRQAEGFQIELVGRNQCKRPCRRGGPLPDAEACIDDGPAKLSCTLPVERIVSA